jgi:hypothetical protein
MTDKYVLKDGFAQALQHLQERPASLATAREQHKLLTYARDEGFIPN